MILINSENFAGKDMKQVLLTTIRNKNTLLSNLRKAKESGTKAKLFMTAIEIEDALKLYDNGADYVILPHFLGGEHASGLIQDFDKNINTMIKIKIAHIKELKHRHTLGHYHPKHNHRHKK